MSAAWRISSSSTPRRPAVSTTSTSYWRLVASATARRATSTGSPTPLPGSGAKTSTPARSPTIWSWVTAFGRWRSQAASIGVWPWPLSQCASLPASVVLPEPCRPASMITVGGFLAKRSRRVSPPRMPTSSSLTILTTCCAGFSASETSAPSARSLTCRTNARTTGSATSASSSAMRISRARGVDVVLGEPALAAQVGQDRRETVGQGVEHGWTHSRNRAPRPVVRPGVLVTTLTGGS